LIAKHVPIRSVEKSNFSGLIKYLSDAQNKHERVGDIKITNCSADNLRAAVCEITATQQLNTRAKSDKTYHLLISFPTGEQPSKDVLKEIEERIAVGLGFEENQRISAVHHDTDNLHIHIAINKIHPIKHTIHEPYYSHKTLAELCTTIEKDYNLEVTNHITLKMGSESRAMDMECHSGQESLIGWIRRECLDDLKHAQSWEKLHTLLQQNDLAIKPRGNGFVFVSLGDEEVIVKASVIDRGLSKSKLEEHLGQFVSSQYHQEKENSNPKPKRSYQKKQLRTGIDTTELYARYKSELLKLSRAKEEKLKGEREKRDRVIRIAKRVNNLKRSAIKTMMTGRVSKKFLYSRVYAGFSKDMKKINSNYKKNKNRIHQKYKRNTWADWLRNEAVKGNADSLAVLRSREASTGLKGNTLKGVGKGAVNNQTVDSITKKGTIIYRVGKSAIKDDGVRLQVSKEATNEALKAALKVTIDRYGSHISLTGTTKFKKDIAKTAALSGLSVSFHDKSVQHQYQEFLTEVKNNERKRREVGSGINRRSNGIARGGNTNRTGYRDDGGDARVINDKYKSNIGGIGRKPPPESKNRLRRLSELGVVRIASGSEVLLQGHVFGNMEQQESQSADSLRRGVFGSGLTSEQLQASEKYIKEREEKRLNGFDILKHYRYNDFKGAVVYAGIRHIDGIALALLEYKKEVMVLPINIATEKRLKRVKIGELISIAKGTIKTSRGVRK